MVQRLPPVSQPGTVRDPVRPLPGLQGAPIRALALPLTVQHPWPVSQPGPVMQHPPPVSQPDPTVQRLPPVAWPNPTVQYPSPVSGLILRPLRWTMRPETGAQPAGYRAFPALCHHRHTESAIQTPMAADIAADG